MSAPESESRSSRRRARRWPVILLGLAGAGSWLCLAPPSTSTPSADPSSEFAASESPRQRVGHPAPPRAQPGDRGASLQSMTASPDPHPHPLDEARRALAFEQQLIGALNDAMDLSDASAMRSLIARYREHVPADENKLAAGYERIADCLEQPGDTSRAAAHDYYDRERASTLRRYVRRHCFER